MPRPRRNGVQLVHGKNRHTTNYVAALVPDVKGRIKPYANDGYADMAEGLGQNIEPQPDGCWYWMGARSSAGYGPYRTVWEILRQTRVRPGYHLHHTCFVKCCVNPDHLEPLKQGEHIKLHAALRRESKAS